MASLSMENLRDQLLSHKLDVNALAKYKNEFERIKEKILTRGVYNQREVEAFLILCLDYYTFSENGDVLITDHDYDLCMKEWISADNHMIIYADALDAGSQWGFRKHDIPGLVGSLGKIYTYKEIKDYFEKYRGIHHFIIAPKYDGDSVGIRVENGEIVYGATRYTGTEGQDITDLIRRASNASTFFLDATRHPRNGYYKCELCVASEDFNILKEIKGYRNRRSATTGLVSTPKNLKYGQYMTIIPLLYYDQDMKFIEYHPKGYREIDVYHPRDLLNECEKLLSEIRTPDFPFRVDGVVIYPVSDRLYVNEMNLLQDAIAYKINTNEAVAKILYGYMSIGRLGKATPMVHIPPTEVNETTVEDASLGSYNQYRKMGLHENEEIIVYSAGDVIPQIKLQDPRVYPANSDYLEIKKKCPYCGEKLQKVETKEKGTSVELCCANEDCPRIITGRITNFIVKLGMMGFSDKTIEDLYNGHVINSLKDLFTISVNDIMELPGYDVKSATQFIEQINQLKIKPIETSTLLGALGIPHISELKCKKILAEVDLNILWKSKKDKAIQYAAYAPGIGAATAEVFVNFIQEHKSLIKYLMETMNIRVDRTWKGNVVFTKFRSEEYKQKFNDLGYEVRDGVSKNTSAVICGSTLHDSGNCKAAMRYDIPIYDIEDLEDLLLKLKRKKDD